MIERGPIELEFHQRPIDVLPDLRLYRRLATLCISISECCRAGSASFKHLHFINSLFMDEDFRALYLDFRAKRFSLNVLTPSADPYLNRCVNYAIGAALLEQKDIQRGFKVALTERGKNFIRMLRTERLAADIFLITKQIGRVSESEVQSAIGERF